MRISDWSSDVCSSDLVNASFAKTIVPLDRIFQRPRIDIDRGGQLAYGVAGGDVATAHIAAQRQAVWLDQVAKAPLPYKPAIANQRSEERREGNECVSPC